MKKLIVYLLAAVMTLSPVAAFAETAVSGADNEPLDSSAVAGEMNAAVAGAESAEAGAESADLQVTEDGAASAEAEAAGEITGDASVEDADVVTEGAEAAGEGADAAGAEVANDEDTAADTETAAPAEEIPAENAEEAAAGLCRAIRERRNYGWLPRWCEWRLAGDAP